MEIAVDSEVLLQPLVGTLRLSICLEVIRSADVLCDVQLFAEFYGEVQCKTCISIGDDSIGYSEVWEDVLHIEGRNTLASNGLSAWEEQRCLGTIVIRDGENGIVSFRWRQIDDEVQGNYTKGYKGMSGCDGEQGNPWFCCPCFGHLTGGAPLDVVPYESLESRPPIPL